MTGGRRRGAAVVAALAVLALGACGDDEPSSSTPRPDVEEPVDKTLDMPFTLDISGDETAQVSGTHQVRVYVRRARGESKPYSVASITLATPAPLPDGRSVAPELGLTGLYDKDGDYTLPAGVGQPPRTGTTAKSEADGTVKVSAVGALFTRPTPPSEVRYAYTAEPCKITFEKNATKGRMSCPSLLSYDGKRISMKMNWGK